MSMYALSLIGRTVLLLTVSLVIFAQTSAPAAKDEREYELATAAVNESNAKAKLELLDTWKKEYPETNLHELRMRLYLQGYQQSNQVQKALGAARELWRKLPEDFHTQFAIVSLAPSLDNADPDLLRDVDSTAQALLDQGLQQQFQISSKPEAISDKAWTQARREAQTACQRALGWVAMQREKYLEAERWFLLAIEGKPEVAQVAYWLARVVLAQQDASKNELAFFSLARASVLTGSGALPVDSRNQVREYLARLYRSYTGGDNGLEALYALANKGPLPPEDWQVASKQEREFHELQRLREENPERYTFLDLKASLLGAKGEETWQELGGKLIPPVRLRVAWLKPPDRPKSIGLTSEEDGETELVLHLENRLRTAIPRGSEVTVEGVATQLERVPFRLTVEQGKVLKR